MSLGGCCGCVPKNVPAERMDTMSDSLEVVMPRPNG